MAKPKTLIQANRGRLFPEFWAKVEFFEAQEECPAVLRMFFRAMLEGNSVVVDAEKAPFFLGVAEDIGGWDVEEGYRDETACPLQFWESN